MMKKWMIGILVAVMVASIWSVSAMAAGHGHGCGRGFIDEDGDGICDYYGSGNGCGHRAGHCA